MKLMKLLNPMKVKGKAGAEVEVDTYHKWNKTVAGQLITFFLHVEGKGAPGYRRLIISEASTGFGTGVQLYAKGTKEPLTERNMGSYEPSQLKRVAEAAMHNKLYEIKPEVFLAAIAQAQQVIGSFSVLKEEMQKRPVPAEGSGDGS